MPDAGTLTARWVWDLLDAGLPRICAAVPILETGGPLSGLSIDASDDGITWQTIIAGDQFSAGCTPVTIPMADSNHRYWGLGYEYVHPGGYYQGLDMGAFLLWGGTVIA